MPRQSCHNEFMKYLFYYALAFLLVVIALSPKVQADENESIINKSQLINANKYAERYCSAKADNFFEGLANEKTLKYSYFKYIGLQSDKLFPREMYKPLINKIRENCAITNEEEKELNEIFFDKL